MRFQLFRQLVTFPSLRNGGVFLGLILLDQVSKYLTPSEWVTMNTGAAFGFTGISPWILSFFLVALTLVWLWYEKQLTLSMSLFLAGALSNSIDRWWLGGVRDWLPLGVGELSNNLADYWIVLGILGVVMRELRYARSS